jgi:hypothetical protein
MTCCLITKIFLAEIVILNNRALMTSYTFKDRACSFLPLNEREEKPRTCGLTEIRGV